MTVQTFLQYLISTLNFTGLMALIAVAIIITYKSVTRGTFQNIIFGCILGLGAVVISVQPLMQINTLQIDPRNLFVGCAAAVFGPLAAIITFLIAAFTRYYEAAPSAYVCIFSLFVAGCCGLGWRYFMKGKSKGHTQLGILGLTISLSYVSTFLLPQEYWASVFLNAIPLLVLINILGSMILGGFLEHYQKLQDRETHLIRQASHDPLTGLLNRRSFNKAYQLLLESSQQTETAFVVLDIDDFKFINDTHGHAIGDEVLVELASTIKDSIKENDLAGRFGGDEFMICLSNSDINETSLLLHRIQRKMSEFQSRKLKSDASVTCSLGACWSNKPLPMSLAFNCADAALNLAKKAGKNQIIVHDHDMPLNSSRNWDWGATKASSHS